MALRVSMGIFGVLALAFSAWWVWGIVLVFQPDFNERRSVDDLVPVQAALGSLGVLAALVAGGSALAYAKTAARPWLRRVALATLCVIPLFATWVYVVAVAASS